MAKCALIRETLRVCRELVERPGELWAQLQRSPALARGRAGLRAGHRRDEELVLMRVSSCRADGGCVHGGGVLFGLHRTRGGSWYGMR
jgi:hypothetical protein